MHMAHKRRLESGRMAISSVMNTNPYTLATQRRGEILNAVQRGMALSAGLRDIVVASHGGHAICGLCGPDKN